MNAFVNTDVQSNFTLHTAGMEGREGEHYMTIQKT